MEGFASQTHNIVLNKTFRTFAVVKTLEIESKDQKNLQKRCTLLCNMQATPSTSLLIKLSGAVWHTYSSSDRAQCLSAHLPLGLLLLSSIARMHNGHRLFRRSLRKAQGSDERCCMERYDLPVSLKSLKFNDVQ